MNGKVCIAGLVLSLVFTASAVAGGPPPICMAVDRIVFEPNEKEPTRVQIWGSFVLCKDNSTYGKPIAGYLYYTVEPGKEVECRREWTKLQKLVADKHIVGLGNCGQPNVDGHIRNVTEEPRSPVAFPLVGNGFANADGYARVHPSIKDLQKSLIAKSAASQK